MKAFRILQNNKSKDVLTYSRRFITLLGSEQISMPTNARVLGRTTPRGSAPKCLSSYGKPIVRLYSSAELPQHFKIKLPALSPTMESGTLVQWLKKEGDSVSEGEPLCEIQTDKATMTFEAPEPGFLAKILLPDNSKDIPVGKLIAVMVSDNKSLSAFANFTGEQASQASAAPAAQVSASTAASIPPSSEKPATAASSITYPQHFKVKMPSLSPTMDSGTLMSWQKQEGDEVKEGDVLCEIQTDKATMAFETPESGFLAKILIPSNTANVPVGKLICVITTKSADVTAFKDFAEGSSAAPAKKPAVQGQPATPVVSQPSLTVSPATSSSSSPRTFSDKPQPLPPVPSGPNSTRILASPLARTIASERGIDLSQIRGTGSDGLVTSTDVLRYVATAPAPATAAARAPVTQSKVEAPTAATPTPAAAAAPSVSGSDYVDIPISNIRKVIAKRLVQSKQTIPHYYLTSDVEVDAVLKVRQELNAVLEKQGKAGALVKLSVNDFIIKAAALACRKVPECNSAWMDSAGVIRKYAKVDMSVAVATDQGLITPIVFNADSKGLSEISANIVSLAKKAREGRLQLNEFQGGTFTISNLGMFGIREFAAVINPPQSCILAVGSASARLLPSGSVSASDSVDEANLRQAMVMSVTLSCDHRVVDGAVGAQWLAEFKRLMEKPSLMLL